MTESESAVMVSDRPAFEPPAGPQYFPPQSPPPPFGYGYIPNPQPAPKRHRVRAALVAVAALVAGGTAAIVIESQRSGDEAQTSATTQPVTSTPSSTPTSTPPASNEPLPTVASQPTTTKTLDTDAIVALVDPAVV
ncbi:MAG TPA: hypothetical protein VH761_06280, partial [Ilumatobacteraceae bacterium]